MIFEVKSDLKTFNIAFQFFDKSKTYNKNVRERNLRQSLEKISKCQIIQSDGFDTRNLVKKNRNPAIGSIKNDKVNYERD